MVLRRIVADTKSNMQLLEQMLTANVDKSVLPPPSVPGRRWAMVDSGSQPNVADVAREFPDHPIRESAGQTMGLQYRAADGSLISNMGETEIVHQEPDGECYPLVIQNARLHSIIISTPWWAHAVPR